MMRTNSGHRLTTAAVMVVSLFSLLLFLPAGVSRADAGPTLTVLADALNVRQGPGIEFPVIGVARGGDVLTPVARHVGSGWYKVQLSGGGSGWVSGAAALVLASSDAASLASAEAGTPSTRSQADVIVFQTVSGGAMYAVNADGGNLRHLTEGIDPALSPDGRTVAFTRWQNSGNGSVGGLWIISIDGSGERQVLRDVRQPKSPTWSPDGKRIALSMQQGGRVDPLRQCIPWGQGPVPPGGELDGNLMCFTIAAAPFWGLRTVDVATGAFEDQPRDRYSSAPTWDPANGWHIVYRGDRGLVNLDLNRKTTWPLTTDGADRAPVLSPDGTRVAVSYRQNDHWEVHVMNAGGSGRVRLTETPTTYIVEQTIKGEPVRIWNNAAPAWSPDGTRVAFLTDRTGRWEIWLMNADGTNQHPLLPSAVASGINLEYHGVDERSISWR